MGKIKDFFGRLLEHIVFWVIISVLSTLGLGWFIRDILIKYLAIEIPIWISILFVFIILIIIVFFIERKRGGIPIISLVRDRMGNEREIPFEYDHLKWIAYIPKQIPFKDEYVWLKGPFCPECNMTLDFKKKKWFCQKCNKYYGATHKKEIDCRKLVKDMCYAEAFRKNKFKK